MTCAYIAKFDEAVYILSINFWFRLIFLIMFILSVAAHCPISGISPGHALNYSSSSRAINVSGELYYSDGTVLYFFCETDYQSSDTWDDRTISVCRDGTWDPDVAPSCTGILILWSIDQSGFKNVIASSAIKKKYIRGGGRGDHSHTSMLPTASTRHPPLKWTLNGVSHSVTHFVPLQWRHADLQHNHKWRVLIIMVLRMIPQNGVLNTYASFCHVVPLKFDGHWTNRRVSAKRPLGPNLCRLVKNIKSVIHLLVQSRYDQVPFWIFSKKMCSSPISTNY